MKKYLFAILLFVTGCSSIDLITYQPNETWVFYGTSLGVTPTHEGYPAELQKIYEDVKIINLSVGGMNSVWGVDNLNKIAFYHPTKVFIEFAVNDCLNYPNPYYQKNFSIFRLFKNKYGLYH